MDRFEKKTECAEKTLIWRERERERERDFVLSASGFEKERDRYEFG